MSIAVQVAIVMVVLLVVMLVTGVPIGVGIGLSPAVSVICVLLGNVAFATSAQRIFTGPSPFSLIVIPSFILAGSIINNGGITLRLVNCAKVLGGRAPGSLARTNVIANTLFGAISDSDAVATAVVGSAMGPLEEREGYSKDYSVVVSVTSVSVGMLISPSNTTIVYSMVAGSVSITTPFMAGYIPGVIWDAGVIILATAAAKQLGYRSSSGLALKTVLKIFWQAVPSLLMIVIVIDGILGDIFTATEGSAVAIVYVTVLSLICSSTKVKDIPRIVLDSAKIIGTVTFMIGLFSVMSWVMASTGIPDMMATTVLSVISNKFLAFLPINVTLLLAGTFMSPTPTILIFTPVFLPICTSLGMSAVQFSVILCYNFSVGAITPPVRTTLSTGRKVGGVIIESVIKRLLSYFGTIITSLPLVIHIPILSLSLSSLLGLV